MCKAFRQRSIWARIKLYSSILIFFRSFEQLIKTELKWTSLLFSWAFVRQLSLSSVELGNRHQTPTLIGCIFLKIFCATGQHWVSFCCTALRSAKPCSVALFFSAFQSFANNLKNFQNFLNCLQLTCCSGLIPICWTCLNFEIHLFSAKPCSLARFFVPAEKNLTFFIFFNWPSVLAWLFEYCSGLSRFAFFE